MNVSPSALPIGAGGFGAVFVVNEDTHTALKVVKNINDASILHAEFKMMNVVYTHMLGREQLFQIPKPTDFSDSSEEASGPYKSLFQQLETHNAIYAMERIKSLPRSASQFVLRDIPVSGEIALCRIYLGLEEMRPSPFFNTRNCPLSLKAYRNLGAEFQDLPRPDEVAAEMGKMLASILVAGFDARDIEFVLAGRSPRQKPSTTPFGFHTFDFNQMRPVTGTLERDTDLLVKAFFDNDKYFPRPRPSSIYQSFKDGYTSSLADGTYHQRLAQEFLAGIETEQRRRDKGSIAKG